ncbi:class I SAM-dependent methyltransferase [Sphingomonas sp. RHCKR47]|uniref:class I SAM-dependent methyltransferase n=1 Tax=Sphingomonas citricola TaxID=2862498 RepID=UPI001C662E5D|nr:class I SAM-dependent methyltransferase [Sphingomonas citricola]MBW6522804.1 class I SAM-dependent methyltransferase [Sphingomonas citricola]
MRALATALGRQLRRPRGLAGQALAWVMAQANRSVIRQTLAAADIRRDSAVLDLGCGGGEALDRLLALAPDGCVHGLDHAPLMVARAQRRHPRATVLEGRFDRLPYNDAAFDRVVAINVAYFWHDAAPVLRELARVLRPGGMVAVYCTEATYLHRAGLIRAGTHRAWSAEELADAFAAVCPQATVARRVAGPGFIVTMSRDVGAKT